MVHIKKIKTNKKTLPPKPLRSLGLLSMSCLFSLLGALQQTFLRSKLWHFGLFGLTVHRAHEPGFDNKITFPKVIVISPPPAVKVNACSTASYQLLLLQGLEFQAADKWHLTQSLYPVCPLGKFAPSHHVWDKPEVSWFLRYVFISYNQISLSTNSPLLSEDTWS